jgi:hypothetical protein
VLNASSDPAQLSNALAVMGDAGEPRATSTPIFIVTGFSRFAGVASNPTEQLVLFLQAEPKQRGGLCFQSPPPHRKVHESPVISRLAQVKSSLCYFQVTLTSQRPRYWK